MRTFLIRSMFIGIVSLLLLASCTGDSQDAASASRSTEAAGLTSSQDDPSAAPQAFACAPRDLPFDKQSMDLTGAWIANDRGVYYLRQIGNVLWWQGMNGVGGDEASLGTGFDNVLHGTIGHDLRIEADWADVPRGEILGHGTLSLQVVEGNDGTAKIRKLDETGTGFGGSMWKPCTPTPP